jgi:hypothetical protein
MCDDGLDAAFPTVLDELRAVYIFRAGKVAENYLLY